MWQVLQTLHFSVFLGFLYLRHGGYVGPGIFKNSGPSYHFPRPNSFQSFGCATFVKLNTQPAEILHAAPRSSSAGKTNGIIWAGMDAP